MKTDRLKAISDRLGPNPSKEQMRAVIVQDPQAVREAIREFDILCSECEAEAANHVLRTLLDNDPYLAMSIMHKVFDCRADWGQTGQEGGQ
jgi:hypothetical protein